MLGLSLLVASLMAQTPSPVDAVVVSIVWPGVVTPASANRVEELVRAELGKAALSVPSSDVAKDRAETLACGATPLCVAALGQRQGAGLAIRIEPASVSRDVVIQVQALDVEKVTVLAEMSLTVAAATLDAELAPRLGPLVETVKLEALKRRAAPQPVEPVVKAVVAPAPAPASPVQRTVGLVVGGAGLASVVAGALVFATAGTVTRDDKGYVFADQASRVPGIQQQQAAGVVLLAVGGALAVGGGLAWLLAPPVSLPLPAGERVGVRACRECGTVRVAIGPGSVVVEGRW